MAQDEHKNRIEWIDCARGICILMVLAGHIIPNEYGLGQWIYSFHMAAFFIMSGYLLKINHSWNENELMDVIRRKASSLLYPYVVFSVISIGISLFFEGYRVAFARFIKTIIFEGISALWFLPALFFTEILVICILRTNKWYLQIALFILAIGSSVLYPLVDVASLSNIEVKIYNEYNVINRIFIGTSFALIGYWCAYAASIFKQVVDNSIFLIFSSSICFFISIISYKYNYVDVHYSIIGNPVIFFCASLAGSFCIFFIAKLIGIRIKSLRFWGENSLILFATHLNLYILQNVEKYILMLGLKQLYEYVAVFMITLIIEYVLIVILNRWGKFLINYNEFLRIVKKS